MSLSFFHHGGGIGYQQPKGGPVLGKEGLGQGIILFASKRLGNTAFTAQFLGLTLREGYHQSVTVSLRNFGERGISH